MKEYSSILEVFSREGYEMYSSNIPASQWGNRQIAKDYLKRYWLSSIEYENACRPVQDTIFVNQDVGLPEMVFSPGYDLRVSCGGCLFDEEDFARLQGCAQALSDKFLFVIENTFGGRVTDPTFRMKFPVGISWDELISGGFASSILLEMPHKEYFVFGESGSWGKYVASDYKLPLDIWGFKRGVSDLLQARFAVSAGEEQELLHALPSAYRDRVQM